MTNIAELSLLSIMKRKTTVTAIKDNFWLYKGKHLCFYHIGKINKDNSITGRILIPSLKKNRCFRIEANGFVTRLPFVEYPMRQFIRQQRKAILNNGNIYAN